MYTLYIALDKKNTKISKSKIVQTKTSTKIETTTLTIKFLKVNIRQVTQDKQIKIIDLYFYLLISFGFYI